ncbi:MAG: phosphate acyltransferase PlsX [Syntrophorhabdales bacterium]|jgi:glycerol-3-phosphate acyltransferase PlsX
MARIAVDAMGGDHAPLAVVRGVEAAVAEHVADVVLVGDEGVISPLLKSRSNIEIVHTPMVVTMDDSPSIALRRKRDSSMNKAFTLLKEGKVDGVVSAGNSGAAMAFAIFTLGRIPGVERPAILTVHPNVLGSLSALLDAGGNVDCRPSHLVQFALMGDVFAKRILAIETPRIGLLSNGEEETKGNELTRETHALLKTLPLNYRGYVEGNDLYNGKTDVVVTDGFVGNVALKVSEGIAELMVAFLKERVGKSTKSKMGYLLLSDVFSALAKTCDYSEYGGMPLVGVDGVCIICHGKSNERALKNAVIQAKSFVGKNLNGHIKDAMEAYASKPRKKEL